MLPTGGYYNGTTTSINDIVTPGISRIYIKRNGDDHKYLEYYGPCLIISNLCVGFLYQILFFGSTATIAWRVNEVQHDITLTYQTKLFKITGEVIER